MPEFIDNFEIFRRRPAMYTGEHSLKSIRCFLEGYRHAIELHGLSRDADAFLVANEFHDWVAYRLHFYESTSGWSSMILGRTETEQNAIDRFFELLAEFKTRTPHVVARLAGCKGTYREQGVERHNDKVIPGPLVERPFPNSILLVTYTDDPGFFAYSETSDVFPCEGYFADLELFEAFTGVDRSLLVVLDEKWDPKPFPIER